uniref:Uncharacterized protein n=1 Tax=Myoviridae sp. ctJ2i1 TaxID=2825079 RepID=A0A8S5V1M4_9CAUD|nr:MAG TPA: hypothetical protein [Myoviridae sp. ctJ2i1]
MFIGFFKKSNYLKYIFLLINIRLYKNPRLYYKYIMIILYIIVYYM